ncbi:MAG: hypothetical protein IT377_11195 [Polyangiaceae bacterium]|nr:hypothetical protein [Polyangiaceae bacterium]
MRWFLLVLSTSLCAAGCGGDDNGKGPPGTGSGGGGGSLPDGGAPDALAPEPGSCRKLCCASSDCSSGESCVAFESAAGTLGTCTPGGDGGAATDAGSTSDGGATFPPSCWTLNTPECNPLTNESCAAGGACDIGGQGDPDTKPVVACYYDDNIQGPGEDCDNVEGPFCVPGYHCVPK